MDTNLVSEAAEVVITVLASALAMLVTYYVAKLGKYLEARFAFDIPDKVESEARHLATRAIYRAEEWARKKSNEAGEKVPSNEILGTAAKYFRDLAKPKVIRWLDDKVEDFIEENLGVMRADGEPPGVPD